MGRGRGSRSRRSNTQRRVMDVRVVPETEGNRAEKVERMLVAYKESQASTRVVVKTNINFGTQVTASAALFGFERLRAEDEFASLAQQYSTYKVSAMRFDIFDQAPAVVNNAIFGTYHQRVSGDAPGDVGEVTDLPDSTEVAPGTGKLRLYWYPSGPTEQSWYSVSDTQSFGGLAVGLPAYGSATPKYSVIASYVVDFRTRV